MKKLLSIVLALAMVLTLTIIPAYAEGTNVVYYVNGTIDGDAVPATAGETYLPDRMPTTAAPEGKYFVGWADSTGEIVSSTKGIVLADGENVLTAVYKPYKAEAEVDLTVHAKVDNPVNIGYMKNGTYMSYVSGRISGAPKTEYITDEETGESYLEVAPNASSGGGTGFPLADADGDVIQLKRATKYQVVMEYRIPENDNALSIRAFDGVQIYKEGINYDQAPSLRNQWGNTVGLCKKGNFWSVTSDSGLTQKWHDNGGYYFRFGATVENAATTDGWKTITWSGTTGAEDANYLPIFVPVIEVAANTYNQKFQIKSIKIIDTSAAEVQYVVDGKVDATVSGLAAGAAYAPDRMPTVAAPYGTYFTGWKDEAGNYVTDSLTLASGVNKLYASYVAFPGKGTSWGTYVWAKGKAFSAPYVTTGGE